MNKSIYQLFAIAAGALLFSTSLLASELEWHGFIAQGVINAPDSGFVNRDGDLSTELTELGINGRYSITPSLHVAGQLVYLDGGNRYTSGLRLDYMLFDWYFYNSETWQANMYLGRYKNQHWLYSSTRDVPFTRPTIVLPQSVYFDAFRDIAVGSDGIALQTRNQNRYGDLTLNWSVGRSPVSQAQGELILGGDIQGKLKLDFDHQASVNWQPEMSHFNFGMVLLDSNFSYHTPGAEQYSSADFSVRRVMFNMRYQSEQWEFSSELQQERTKIDGFFAPQFTQDTIGQGAYVLVQYRHSPKLKWFGMLDYSVIDKNDRHGKTLAQKTFGLVPAYFGYQQSVAWGASLDLSHTLRLSAEAHFVEGTGRLSPVIVPDVATNQHKYWQLYAVQLMYRF